MITSRKQHNSKGLRLVTLLLFVQYLRPQDFIPGLSGAPLFLPIAIIIMCYVVFSGRMQKIINISQWPVFLFFCWMVLLTPFAQSPGASVKGLRSFIPLLPFVLYIPLAVNDAKSLRKLINVKILIVAVIAAVGIYTHSKGRYNNFSFGNFLTDPNDFALYMNVMFPICFFMFLYERQSSKRKFYYLIATLLTVAGVVCSFSRGGFLGLLCIGAVIWWFSNKKMLLSVSIALLACGVLLFSSNQWKETASTAFDSKQSTAQGRLKLWGLSLRVFTDHPMGVGINNIPRMLHEYADGDEYAYRLWGKVNHSFWFTVLAEGGIIGILIVMMLLRRNTRLLFQLCRLEPIDEEARFLKHVGYAYIGSLTGFCVSGTFLSCAYYPHLWYMTAIIAASGKVLCQISQKESVQ